MPIKTSGPISFQDIANEFGGTKPYKLGDYHRGERVPDSTVNSNIAKSGALSLGDFYGATNILSAVFVYKNIFVNSSLARSGNLTIPARTDGDMWCIVACSQGRDGGDIPRPFASWRGLNMPYYVDDVDYTGSEANRVTIQAVRISQGEATSGQIKVENIESNNRGGTNEVGMWIVGGINNGTTNSTNGTNGTLSNSDQCVVVGGASWGKWNDGLVNISPGVWSHNSGGVGITLSSGLSNVSVTGGQGRGCFWLKI